MMPWQMAASLPGCDRIPAADESLRSNLDFVYRQNLSIFMLEEAHTKVVDGQILRHLL